MFFRASLSEHAFSSLSTPVHDARSPSADVCSRTSSGGSIGRIRSRNGSSTTISGKRQKPIDQDGQLDVKEDYGNYLRDAIERYFLFARLRVFGPSSICFCDSFANSEGAASLNASFDDSCRVYPQLQTYPSIDEDQPGVFYEQLGGRSGATSWHRQRSTRISSLLTSGNSTDRSSSYSWGEDISYLHQAHHSFSF